MTLPKIQKKHLVFTGLVVLLCITGFANYRINQSAGGQQPVAIKGEDVAAETGAGEGEPAEDVAATTDYFAAYRAERTANRDQEIAYIDSIIADERTDAETLAEAQQQKLDLASAMEKETIIEGLVMAKGFSECVTTIKNGSINVVVENVEPLNAAQATQIMEIVRRETDEAPENIKIMPRN